MTESETVPAEEGLRRLIAGNERFVAGKLTAGDALARDRATLAQAQHPFAVVLSCSDSRVPPELVFDQPPGQLFVIRTAGQVVDEAARSSIVYGIEALRVPLLVVLGHAGCGAVTAALAAQQGSDVPSYAYRFVTGIAAAVRGAAGEPGDRLENAVRANVRLGVERLRADEPELAGAVRAGRLTIAGGYYDLASGAVSFLDRS